MESAGSCTICGRPSKKLYNSRLCGRIARGPCIELDVCRSCAAWRKMERNLS